MRLVMMAGGTGGHVFPALAVARELRDKGVEVLWIGTRRGFEAQAVPAAGFEIAWIDIAGLRGKGWRDLLRAPLQLLSALWQAVAILRRFRPRLVIGMGGYASGPGGLAAWLLRKPLIIHEQNAAAGTTNRLLARLARRVLQAYPDAFSAGPRVHTVGNPVRDDILAVPAPERRGLGEHRPPRLLVLGGSLGALALNRTVPAALARLELDLEVRHQAGRTLATAQSAYAEAAPRQQIELLEFIDDMAAAMAWADLLVARAGALTLAEVAAVGLPSILVPFPHAIDDHQTRNARHLVDAGAAVLMPESGLSADALAQTLHQLISEPGRLTRMATAAQACSRRDATARIVAECWPYLGEAA